jgi:hypothetical protein
MSTKEEKYVKKLLDDKNDKRMIQVHPSEFFPGSDEIRIREFAKANQNVPFTKGAFRKCKTNGVISNYDIKRNRSFQMSSLVCAVSSGFSGFIIYVFLGSVHILDKGNFRQAGMFFIGGTTIGIIFSILKFRSLYKEFDKKYSAIWLKSIGKI